MLILLFLHFSRKHPALALIGLTTLIPLSLGAQDKSLLFEIVHHGETRGVIRCILHNSGDTCRISLESTVKARFLWEVRVHTAESCEFGRDGLISGTYEQQVNEGKKEQTRISRRNNGYFATGRAGQTDLTHIPVRFTTLSLYFQEPVNISEVYSCSLQQLLPITRVAPGKYRLSVSENKINFYNYEEGRLVRVDVEQPFYPVQFIAKK